MNLRTWSFGTVLLVSPFLLGPLIALTLAWFLMR